MAREIFSQPCPQCATGEHGQCEDALCGCIVVHQGDSQAMRGFKLVKQRAHPERAAWTKGGFTPGSRALDIHANPNSRTKGTKMTDQAQSPHDDAESHPVSCTSGDLALHLASEHADPMAMDRPPIENEDQHHHEHTGPGTIRHHAEYDFSYDRRKVSAILREAEGDDWQQQETPPGYDPDEAETLQAGEDREPAPEEDARMRSLYRQLMDSPVPGDTKFDVEEGLTRLMDRLRLDPPPGCEVAEILAQHQEDAQDRSLSEETCLALHLASGHHDDQAFFRTVEQNEEVHRAIPGSLHQHADVQHRYELALVQKIEADLGDGTVLSWSSAPHPPHDVTDLARMIGTIHDQAPEMPADLIAVDLAWIKTAAWPWHRRLRAAILIAFPRSWPPSWYIDKRVRKFVRK